MALVRKTTWLVLALSRSLLQPSPPSNVLSLPACLDCRPYLSSYSLSLPPSCPQPWRKGRVLDASRERDRASPPLILPPPLLSCLVPWASPVSRCHRSSLTRTCSSATRLTTSLPSAARSFSSPQAVPTETSPLLADVAEPSASCVSSLRFRLIATGSHPVKANRHHARSSLYSSSSHCPTSPLSPAPSSAPTLEREQETFARIAREAEQFVSSLSMPSVCR